MYKKLGLLGGVLGLLFVLSNLAQADTSGWLSPATLNLLKQTELTSLPPSLSGNIDCFPEISSCVVNATYGSANTSSAVRLNGTTNYRTAVNSAGQANVIAIPNSDTVMTFGSGPSYGLNLFIVNNFSSSITLTNTNGTLEYKINHSPDARLADKTNHLLAADPASISFSSNSQWMVVSQPNVGMLRINLQTFEVLPFGMGFNYTIGLSPGLQTAITNDGRYAVVASKNFSRFTIYDLSTCGAAPDTITGPVVCQSRDLQTFMQQQVTGYSYVSSLRFISDDTLSLYATYTQGTVLKTARFILSTAAGTIHQLDYLALGDSYISGEGAFNYQQGTDTSDNTCHLSLISYPLLLGHDLNYNSFHSVACSGASTPDIINTGLDYAGQAEPKTKREKYNDEQISSILSQFSPGYIDQLDFSSFYQPKAITISIGGNDIGFSAILRRCLEPDTCYSSYEDRLELVREINTQLFPKLINTYQKIKAANAPDSRIYVVGYPQIAKPDGDCGANVHLNNDEIKFASQLIAYLDLVVQKAAENIGVRYVDAQDALNDHRLCEADPGSAAVNGLTAGNDFPDKLGGPIGRESYHPNDIGHQFLENAVLAGSQNLNLSMPSPNSAALPPAEVSLEILNAPHSGRAINLANYDDSPSNNVVYRGGVWNTSVKGIKFALKSLSPLKAVLHSAPVDLGSYATDSKGDLSVQIPIPADVPAGFHMLHLYGTNLAGDPIDIYTDVYVAATQTDADGDGIPNDSDPCQAVANSGQDYDKDKTDDACDSFIDQAPVAPVEPPPDPSPPASPDPSPTPSPTPDPEPSPPAPEPEPGPPAVEPSPIPPIPDPFPSSPPATDPQTTPPPSDPDPEPSPTPTPSSTPPASDLPPVDSGTTTPTDSSNPPSDNSSDDSIQNPTSVSQVASDLKPFSTAIQNSPAYDSQIPNTSVIDVPKSQDKVLSSKISTALPTSSTRSVSAPIHIRNWQTLLIVAGIFLIIIGLSTIQQLQRH